MKSFIKVFGVSFLLLIQLTGCLKDDNYRKPVYYFYDEPVVVDQMGDHPIVRNESYLFYVPELVDNAVLKAGNLLWTSFIVDLDDQEQVDAVPCTKQYMAKSFRYETVDSAKVIIPENAEVFESYLSDDYSGAISLAVLYNYRIDSLWFFGFRQQDRSNYTYELILNPEMETGSDNIPTLYIRAKQVIPSIANSGNARSKDGNIFAFDVAGFVNYYRETISNSGAVRFNLKYKIGVDANGKDIYRSFMSNPISWDFGSEKQ